MTARNQGFSLGDSPSPAALIMKTGNENKNLKNSYDEETSAK
jgi:hypothetical protein